MDVQYPVEAMVARPALELPEKGRYSYEPKLDGWRMIAFQHGRRVQLQSRQQRSLTHQFPDIAHAVGEQLPPGTVVDGELVALRDGRVDFTALTSRNAPRFLVAFDVLADRGHDVRAEPLWSRRDRLASLVGDAEGGVLLAPAVDEVAAARIWMERHAELGIEGLVVKALAAPYRPRQVTWSKIRATHTTEAVVGAVIGPITQPHALILGQQDRHGRLRIIGRTHRLRRAAADELGARLTPPRGVHPWPAVIPGGRLGLPGATDDVPHTPVHPALVVEIDVDTAVDHGRARHGVRYRRLRPDLLPDDLQASGAS